MECYPVRSTQEKMDTLDMVSNSTQVACSDMFSQY